MFRSRYTILNMYGIVLFIDLVHMMCPVTYVLYLIYLIRGHVQSTLELRDISRLFQTRVQVTKVNDIDTRP